MRQKLYLECYAGISGDMTVAALLDLGADKEVLKAALGSLHLDGYEIEISRVKKSGLDACDFAVKLDKEHENHDHDMEYLHGHVHEHEHSHEHGHENEHSHEHGHEHEHSHEHGHEHEHSHEHVHEHEHNHEHSHEHGHEHIHEYNHEHNHEHEHSHEHGHSHGHTHSHVHRGLPEIYDIIEHSEMTENAKNIANRIFDILADAEAKAHGVPKSEVHFHEVGAVDSIVDIAAAAVCLDNLSVKEVIVPVLYEGCGYIRCQHGVIPVPVPATLNIVSAHRLKLHQTDTEGEFVTPTGAAIAAAVRTGDRLPDTYVVKRIGIGAGKRNYERPSILRAMLIEEVCDKNVGETETCGNKNEGNDANSDKVCKLECNLDDCNGEALGFAMSRLFRAGALEVNYTPVYMKKNRPAYLLTVLCKPNDRERMEQILFEETTTIGVRRQFMERTVLERKNRKMMTSLGEVEVKILCRPDGKRLAPEYESVAGIAREKNISFLKAYQLIEAELSETESSKTD